MAAVGHEHGGEGSTESLSPLISLTMPPPDQRLERDSAEPHLSDLCHLPGARRVRAALTDSFGLRVHAYAHVMQSHMMRLA